MQETHVNFARDNVNLDVNFAQDQVKLARGMLHRSEEVGGRKKVGCEGERTDAWTDGRREGRSADDDDDHGN